MGVVRVGLSLRAAALREVVPPMLAAQLLNGRLGTQLLIGLEWNPKGKSAIFFEGVHLLLCKLTHINPTD